MLGRTARAQLQRRRKLTVSYNLYIGASLSFRNLPRPSSKRNISLSTITEPLDQAVKSLPHILQHEIPHSILSLSETWVPAGLPTYTTGLFIFALLTRMCFFTPWSYWARRRKWKIKEEVVPRLLAEAIYGWSPPLKAKLARQNVPQSIQRQIINENMIFRKEELEKQLNCTMIPTILVPTLFTLPAFIISTSIAYSAATTPEILSNINLDEMFLLPFQQYPPILPFAIAVVGMLNVEVGTWSPKSLKSMRDSVGEKEVEAGVAKPGQKQETLEVKPGAVAVGFYRALNVGRGVFCLTIPGTVHIIWFTSSLIGLFESMIFNVIERSRARQLWERNSPLLQLRPRQLEKMGIDLSPIAPLERLGQVDYGKSNRWTLDAAPKSTLRSIVSNTLLRTRSIPKPTATNTSRRLYSTGSSSRAGSAVKGAKSSTVSSEKSREGVKDSIVDCMERIVSRFEAYERRRMGKGPSKEKEAVTPTSTGQVKGPSPTVTSPVDQEKKREKLRHWIYIASSKEKQRKRKKSLEARQKLHTQQPRAPYFIVLKREERKPKRTIEPPAEPKAKGVLLP